MVSIRLTVEGRPSRGFRRLGCTCRRLVAASAKMRRLVWCTLVLALLGCEREQRLPYIPPELKNWPHQYRGVSGLKIEGFVTGWVTEPAGLVYRGGGLTTSRRLPVLAFAIHHPRQGLVLFGTGLSHQVVKDPGSQTSGLMALMEQVEAYPGQDLPAQLRAEGLDPKAVRWVVLPSMRFAQTGELEAFPNARVVVARAEREYARDAPAGYAPSSYDGVQNWKFVEFPSDAPLGTFASHVDLFGDGSCVLLDASGTTPGTMALLVRLPSAPLVLAGDLAPVDESLRYTAEPRWAFDADQWWDHIWRLKRFHDLDPDLRVIPGYDVAPLWSADLRGMTLHDFTPSSQPS
jgi:N-acyl homoserine lactone hydrolase